LTARACLRGAYRGTDGGQRFLRFCVDPEALKLVKFRRLSRNLWDEFELAYSTVSGDAKAYDYVAPQDVENAATIVNLWATVNALEPEKAAKNARRVAELSRIAFLSENRRQSSTRWILLGLIAVLVSCFAAGFYDARFH
jgi:hypothetical protein